MDLRGFPHRGVLTLFLTASLLLATVAQAEPLIPKMNAPESYKDFRFGVSEVRKNIESVSCGGWDPAGGATLNGGELRGDIPLPEMNDDLPGRKNEDPLYDPKTGVGKRGAFSYPDSAFGYLSACDVVGGEVFDEDLARAGLSVRWQVENGDDPNAVVVSFRTEGGNGMIEVNPERWCLLVDKATPQWCKKLYEVLTGQLGPYLHTLGIEANPLCPDPPKRYCTDPMFTKECRGQECRTTDPPAFRNKITECHLDFEGRLIIDVLGGESASLSSFYRHYANDFMGHFNVKGGGKDWDIRAECYEYYQENDPKDVVTDRKDEQCEFVVATPSEQAPDPLEWPDEEKQKQPPARPEGPVAAPDRTVVKEPSRSPRILPEPWVADPETNLSLIDMDALKETQKDFENPTDITGILGALLPVKQRASKTVPPNARTDAFDDTDHRAFITYWEAQERELLKMTADPETRMILPARFLVGIDDDDPLFHFVTQRIVIPDGTVELTLRAGPDDLQSILLSLQRMFVAPLQEVRLPVIVPLASELEIDSLIFQWEEWKKQEDLSATAAGRASNAGDADSLIAILEQYRSRVAEVRRMRLALAALTERLYDGQEEIRQYFTSWFTEQQNKFEEAIEHAEERRTLRRIWRLIDRSLLQAEAWQTFWCSNQRYSLPIYSLLDEWWGKAAPGESRDPEYSLSTDNRFDPLVDLVRLRYREPETQVFDFSDMRFPRDPLLLPVLWPVQVKLRLPSPPLIGAKPPSPSSFPPLPAIPDEHIFDTFEVPEVSFGSKPTVALPPTADLSEAIQVLRAIRVIIDGTDIDTQKQEETALENGEHPDQGDFPKIDAPLGRDNFLEAYARFPRSVLLSPDPEGKHGNPAKIIHVENDLRERLMRLISRWAPERLEDMGGRTVRLAAEPEPECHEGVLCRILPPMSTQISVWQWFMPEPTSGVFDDMLGSVRRLSLPATEPQNPYQDASQPSLKRLFPTLTLPIPWTVVRAPQANP